MLRDGRGTTICAHCKCWYCTGRSTGVNCEFGGGIFFLIDLFCLDNNYSHSKTNLVVSWKPVRLGHEYRSWINCGAAAYKLPVFLL